MAIGFFDGNKADASPESVKRKREMIARMLSGNNRAPQNVGEGFNAIGNNIAAAITSYRADNAERANNAERSRLMSGLFGGGTPMAAVGGAPVATGRTTGSAATGSAATGASVAPARNFSVDPSIRDGIASTAQSLGISPVDLATAISYETAGTFDPTKRGPTTQWGQHKGFIQFGQPQAKQHGVDWNNPVGSQLGPDGAVASYLRSTGVKPGMGLLDIYSAINAGGVGRYNRSDANNGGAPGTVRDKVEQQMAGHRAKALALFPDQTASNMPVVRPGPGAAPMPLARQQVNTAPMPNAGLADLPAPSANQSAMNVAPVSGDNPQQLLADAAYYEQNGNIEAARQMRERAAMAGQAAAMPQGGPPMAPGGGVPIANNEQDVQFLEARMAAEQGAQAPMPAPDMPNAQNAGDVFSNVPMGLGANPFVERPPFDPAQEGMPNAQNSGDVFAPIPMGLGANPFVQRPPFAQSPDMPSPAAQEVAINPAQDTVALPASNVQPEAQPQRQPMPQSLPVDMGGENGATPMAFIQDQFARQDQARGLAPRQIYNPFVQRPPEAPQMPAGGGSVPADAQTAPMGGAPAAQAQAQSATRPGMIPERDLVAVLSSRFTTPEDKRFAIDTINQQRAMQQSEADRARVQAQNEAAARAAGIDPALLGNPVIGKAATEAKFREAPETFRTVTDQAERRALGIPDEDKRPYQVSSKTQKLAGIGGAQTTVNVMPNAKADEKFSEAFAKGDADALGTIATAGIAARRNMARIDRLEGLINANPTGGLAELKRRAGEFGINTKNLNAIQAAQALINSLVPEQRQPGSGTMSDADLALFKESLPRIINQPDGNKIIINTMRGIAKYDAEGAAIVQQLRDGRLNRAQAFEMLQNRVNPLADLSMPRSQTGGTTSAPPSSPAQGGFRILKVE